MTDKSKIIILDTETTGIKENDQILQLSIINANGHILFDSYIKPRGRTEWNKATQINNITYEMVKNCHTLKYYQKQIQEIFNNSDIIIGYNIYFDLNFLSKYIDLSKFNQNNIIDVMEIFSNEIIQEPHYKGGYKWQKLTKAANYYGYNWKEHGNPHGATADTFATLYVYNMIQQYGKITFENIQEPYNNILNEINQKFNFKPKINYKIINDYLITHETINKKDFQNIEIFFFQMLYKNLTAYIKNAPFEIKLIYNKIEPFKRIKQKPNPLKKIYK